MSTSRCSGALTATLGGDGGRGRAGGRRQQAWPDDDAARDQAQGHQGNAPSPDAGLHGMLAGDGPCVAMSDLAAEIGIKSASVHHHFPTKATMAAAVARRYADRFFAAVARRASETADDAIAAYRSTFKAVVDRDGLMCLFGVLGAEAGGLSPEIASEVPVILPPMH